MKHSATRLINLGFLSATICMGIFVWVTYANFKLTLAGEKAMANTLQSLRMMEHMKDNIQKAETSQQGYIITGKPHQLAMYNKAVQAHREDSAALYALAKNNPSIAGVLFRLEQLVRAKYAFTDTLVQLKEQFGYQAAALRMQSDRGKALSDSITHLVHKIETEDRKILKNSNLQRLEQARKTTLLFFILSGIFFLGFGVAFLVVQRINRRRRAYQKEVMYLSSLVSQTSETILSTDNNFIVRSWNKAAEKMYGFKADQAIGKRIPELFTMHMDKEQLANSLHQLHENGFYKNEYKVSLRDNTSIFVEASVTLLKGSKGQNEGYVAVHKDISEAVELQRQSRQLNEQLEEKVATKTAELTNIFERITDAFAAIDINGALTYLNKRAEAVMAFAPGNVTGEHISNVFPGESGRQLNDLSSRAMKEQKVGRGEIYVDFINKWFDCTFYPSEAGLSLFIRDITEQKKLAREYLERESKYRALIEVSSDAILIKQDGIIQYANPAALAMFGATHASEIEGMPYLRLCPSRYHEAIIARDENLVNDIVPSLIEEQVVRLDGAVIDVEVVANSFSYNGNIAIQVVLRNLSERKEIEKQLRASDKIFTHSIDLLCMVGTDGFFKVVNPAWTQTLGWSREALMEKPWITFIHPGEKPALNRLVTNLPADGEVNLLESRFLCSDGSYKWLSWHSFSYPSESIFFMVARDITSNKAIEEALFNSNQLFESIAKISPVGISRSGLEGECLYVNERWCGITGITPEQALGRAWYQSIHPDDLEKVARQWQTCSTGHIDFKMEFRFLRPNGFVTWVIGQMKAEFNPAGEKIGYVGSVTDISEIKLAEQLIRNSAEGLKKAQHYAHLGSWSWKINNQQFNWSDEMYRIFGVENSASPGYLQQVVMNALQEEDLARIEAAGQSAISGTLPAPMELEIVRPDGMKHILWLEAGELTVDEKGQGIILTGIMQDITQRKQAELEVLKANRLYEFISHINQLMLKSKDSVVIFEAVCRIAVKYGKFRMAWIGLVNEETRLIEPVAFAGWEEGYLDAMVPICLDDVEEGNGPTGKAMREGRSFFSNDISNDPSLNLWKAAQLKRGYHSSIAIPIIVEEKVLGSFNIYAGEVNFFSGGEVQLLQEVTANIGYALGIADIEKRRKTAEEEFRKLSAAVTQSAASVVITNLKGDIEYINPAFTKTTGYTQEESIGKNTNILKSGFSDPEIYTRLWQNLQAGLEWTGTFCNRKKDGELFWESATISPIVNEKGDIINYVAVKEDITDKIMSEEQLFKEKELSDSIINSLPGLFYLYSEDGDFIRWNKNVETVSGYTVAELKNMRPVDFFEERDRKRVADLVKAVFNGQKMAGMEAAFCTKSGRKIPYYFNSLSIIYEGIPCIIGTGIDLTDRKKAEEENRRLGLIASLTINSVILTDEKGVIQWVNTGFERITGYGFDEVIGKKPGVILQGPESDPLTITYMRERLGEQKGFKVEIINYNKWGEKYWLDIEVVPIFNEEQQLTGFLAIERDITDRKNAETELMVLNNHLRERASELAASNTELERFAYVASHDLQEPLRMVISFMDLLKKNYRPLLDEKGYRYIDFAVGGAERMKQLIMDLLEYSRVGTSKEVFVPTDMNTVLKQVTGIFYKQVEEHTAEITSSILPVIIANRSQMAQLLQNLIGNAVKYRGAAVPLVHVDCIEQASHYLFSVSDNGIGIEEEHYDRIFILFQRLHLKSEYAGTGIGLTICKKIVERHGGAIWLTSEPGKGSTFFFTIPK